MDDINNSYLICVHCVNCQQVYIKDIMILGCHFGRDKKLGIADVLRELHTEFGARCGQIFVGSPRSPKMSEASEKRYREEAVGIKAVLQECGMKLFIHSPYTLNFCAQGDDEYWITAMVRELGVADAMGAEGCVLHMGKAVKLAVDRAKEVFHENLLKVITQAKAAGIKSKIFVETSAGQGTELYPTKNNTLDSLVRFYSRFTDDQKKHIKLCVDTCHIFAAGYDISTEEGNQRFWSEWEQKLGMECLAVIHMNNSVKPLGCCVDRHAPLAAGAINMRGLSAFAKSAALYHIPMVIETPFCQFDIDTLSDMINLPVEQLVKRDWEQWFRERQMSAMFNDLGM